MARSRLKRWIAALVSALVTGVSAVFLAAFAFVMLFRWVPLPGTSVMLVRVWEGHAVQYQWVAMDGLPEHIPRAFVAAEDATFCSHRGVDWVQLRVAVEEWAVEDKPLRGASTLSMQTTKNALLWPGRSFLRKAMELPLTPVLELLWGKQRVLEVYLNIAEMGPGVFGIEAAAQHHFNKAASALTRREVARIAAIMPNPLERSPVKPSAYTRERGRTIEKGIGVVDLGCVQ